MVNVRDNGSGSGSQEFHGVIPSNPMDISPPPFGDPTLAQVVANQTQILAMMMQQMQRQYPQQQMQAPIQAQSLNQSQSQYFKIQAPTPPTDILLRSHQTNAPPSLSYWREANVICEDCEEQGHHATNCPWNMYTRTPIDDKAQCPREEKRPSQLAYRNYGAPPSNSKKRKTLVWKMDDSRNLTITGSEFTPEDAAKIPRRLRGNTFHGARQLTQHLRLYGPPKPGTDGFEEVSSDDDDEDDGEILKGEKEMEFKACTRCGEIGHTINACSYTCPCGEDTHSPDECPTRKITCFLCEGTDHVPKNYQLDVVPAKIKEDQRTPLQPVRQSMAVASNITAPDLQSAPIPVDTISSSRSATNKVEESPLTPVSVVSVQTQEDKQCDQPRVDCYNCLQLGHYLNKCPFPRPKKLVHRCFNCGDTSHLSDGCSMPKRQYLQGTGPVYDTLTSPIASASAQQGQIQRRSDKKKSEINRHLDVRLPPQRIIVKATNGKSPVSSAIVPKLQSQSQQGKQCQDNDNLLQPQEDRTIHPQQPSKSPQHQFTWRITNQAMHPVLLRSRWPSTNCRFATSHARRSYQP
jgi:hypothetical protein